jgi:hypothetical protein
MKSTSMFLWELSLLSLGHVFEEHLPLLGGFHVKAGCIGGLPSVTAAHDHNHHPPPHHPQCSHIPPHSQQPSSLIALLTILMEQAEQASLVV